MVWNKFILVETLSNPYKDFLHHKILSCLSKILLIHFPPYRNSFSTKNSLSCLSNILLRSFYSPSILEKLCFLPSKNFFKTKKDKNNKKMKPSRRNLQKKGLRRIKNKLQDEQAPPIPLYSIYFLSFTLDILQVLCDH